MPKEELASPQSITIPQAAPISPPIRKVNCDTINNIPANYKAICDCVQTNAITCPSQEAVTGTIFQNSRADMGYGFKKGNRFSIDTVFIRKFKQLTSKSSHFMWGEVGTFYTDYIIEFYDAKGKVTNKAEISYDGMLIVTPRGITKWGGLTSKGEYTLKTLMNKYTKPPTSKPHKIAKLSTKAPIRKQFAPKKGMHK